MTHVKNVEAFSRLVDFCTGYGGKYKPGPSNLQVEVLTGQLVAARTAMDQVKITKSLFDTAVNSRTAEFSTLGKLAASILLTMQASGAKKETVDDARLFVRQISGYSRKNREAIPAPENKEVKPRKSSLQLAFVSKADWFSKLVQALEMEPLYNPNEKELNKATLLALSKQLDIANSNVAEARVAWSNARIERNNLLYGNRDSMHNSMSAVKKYVRAIFGINSEQYAQVKSLEFIKPAK